MMSTTAVTASPPVLAQVCGVPLPVLVVDDDRSFRELVTLALRAHGFAVSGAVDGVDGLTNLAGCQPVAILTDMQMPNMDGLDFCLRVRAIPAYDHTPIMVLTGGDVASERMIAVSQLHAVTALSKTMPMNNLVALLRGARADMPSLATIIGSVVARPVPDNSASGTEFGVIAPLGPATPG